MALYKSLRNINKLRDNQVGSQFSNRKRQDCHIIIDGEEEKKKTKTTKAV